MGASKFSPQFQRNLDRMMWSKLKQHIWEGRSVFSIELIDQESLMCWLNDYMETMAQVVLAHGGIVDKFIGMPLWQFLGCRLSV